MKIKYFSNGNKLARLVLTVLFILSISVSIPAHTAQAQTPTDGPIMPDALPLPNPIMTLKDQAAAAATSNAPGYYDTSAYMIGKVVVGIIMPQCTNATPGVCTQTWTAAQQNTVVSKVQTGMNFWKTTGGAPANLNFQFDVQASIPTSYEPINQPVNTECYWVSDTLTHMGYTATSSCATNAYAHFAQVYAYVNHLRTQYHTDWAYAMIVANSPDSASSTFAGGQYFAYAYLGGPFLIMTYGNGGWLSSRMDQVAAHETGHIFGAADEYYQPGYGGCTSTTQRYGYLGIPNGNCQNPTPTGVPSIMINDTYALDSFAAGQIGWRDSNSNGIPDPIDTIPTVTLSPYTPNPTTQTTLTYNGSAQIPPLPKAVCGGGDQCYLGGSVTTQTISNVQYQLDGTPWMNGTASDGAFNTDFENFNFTTLHLPGGVHTIGVHSQASQSNLSTTWTDSVTVNAPAAAPPPSNDDFNTPKVIPSIAYSDLNLDTTAATTAPDDPSIPNCASNQGFASVWYSYTPSANQDLYLDTFGSNYDTLLAVWTGTRGSLVAVACNDTPDGITNQAALPLSVTAGTTYYFEIIQYTRPPSPQIQAGGGILDFHVNFNAKTDVYIGGALIGSYNILQGGSTRQNYSGVDSGPVKVVSTNAVPIIASIRDSWWNGTSWTSYAQLMGLPANQLSDTYLFPAYNNVTLDDQLRFGNVGVADTTVTVTIGGIVRGTYLLHPNGAVRVNYAGLDSGPVKVQSSGSVPIIASIRDSWWDGTSWTSYAQLMGLPASQLSDTYMFPAYNNVTLDEQLRFGNVGVADTTVTVTIGGIVKGTYLLHPNEAVRVNYAGLDSGPVKVQSSGTVPIIASIRDSWWNGTSWTSYVQLMGLPASQLSDTYMFPAYNNVTLDDQLRFGNVGVADTTVTVTIGGIVRGTYLLHPNGAVRVNYAGLDSGPVKVQSSGSVPIIASIRDSWWDGTSWTSYAQLMGLPVSLMSNTYLFPAYNNVTLDDQLRFGYP